MQVFRTENCIEIKCFIDENICRISRKIHIVFSSPGQIKRNANGHCFAYTREKWTCFLISSAWFLSFTTVHNNSSEYTLFRVSFDLAFPLLSTGLPLTTIIGRECKRQADVSHLFIRWNFCLIVLSVGVASTRGQQISIFQLPRTLSLDYEIHCFVFTVTNLTNCCIGNECNNSSFRESTIRHFWSFIRAENIFDVE
jgi:hypothetical protein